MGTINILDEHLINLIAAGEVIERGASVVKELVENSIDANATSVVISLVDSGIKEITVLDNGYGMDVGEMKKAILPHATSKIKDESDLFSIRTLGFRGEALASIVSVSNVKIKSSPGNGKGFMMGLKAGVITAQAFIGHPQGTEIQVRDLFFNTPARLQNLKSIQSELSYVTDYVTKIALANPQIAFKLSNNNNKIFQSFGNGNLLEVLSSVYDVNVAKNMINICADNTLFKISGLISNISITRSSRNNITLIVNGRVVKNNSIINAIIDGYKTLLTVGRYPICVINIWVDYSLVDVNVHPTKAEVRFSEEDKLIELIKETVSKSLLRSNLIVNNDEEEIDNDKNENIEISNDTKLENKETTNDQFIDKKVETFEDKTFEDKTFEVKTFEDNDYEDDFDESEENENIFNENNVEDKEEPEENSKEFETEEYSFSEKQPLFDNDIITEKEENIEIKEKKEESKPVQQAFDFTNNNNEEQKEIDKIGELHFVGQLFGTYILAQNEDFFYMIDQHAANERVNYEKIIRALKNENVVKYELLIPINIEFTPSETILVHEKMNEINSLGIELEEFGGNTFTVRVIPLWINQKDAKDFIEEIIMQIIKGKKSTKEEFLDNISKSLACKRSVKANEFLSTNQISYLLEDLIKCSNPYTCPHGRPIIIKYSKYQVEKWFKRVQ